MSNAIKIDQNLATNSEYISSMVTVKLAKKIEDLLDSKEISKSELADAIGSSKAYISKVLSADNNFTIKTLAKLAIALDQSFEVVLKSKTSNIKTESSDFGRKSTATVYNFSEYLSARRQANKSYTFDSENIEELEREAVNDR